MPASTVSFATSGKHKIIFKTSRRKICSLSIRAVRNKVRATIEQNQNCVGKEHKKREEWLICSGKILFQQSFSTLSIQRRKFNSVIADLDLQIYLPLFVMALTKRHIETFVLPLKLLMKYLKSTLVVFICKRLGCKHHLALCIERSKTFASPNTGDWTLSANNDNIKTI